MNLFSLLRIAVSTVTAMGALVATAGVPVKNPSCQPSATINHPDNSRGLFFDENCQTAYVLPPLVGEFTVDGITTSELLDRCPEVDEYERQLLEITRDIGKVGQISEPDETSKRPRRGRIPKKERETPEPSNESLNSELSPERQLQLVELLKKRKDLLEKMYASVGSVPAANVSLGFAVDTAALINEYQDLNKAASVNFVPMPLSFSALSIVPKKVESSDFPITHSSNSGEVPGSSLSGKRKPSRNQLMVNFDGSSSTTVTLSLFGACKLRNPITGTIPKRVSAYSLKGMVNVVHEFEYEVQSFAAYKARYNLGALAKLIKQNSTSGGFFKTSSISKVTDDRSSKSWFEFESECNDSRHCPEYTQKLKEEIKARLVGEVLNGIVLAQVGPKGFVPDAGNAPGNGAGVAADGLRQCPHAYCQAGAIVLDVLNASFGGQSKTDQFIATNDHMAGDEVIERRMMSFGGTLKFDAKR